MAKRTRLRAMIPLLSGLLLVPALHAADQGQDGMQQQPEAAAPQEDFEQETLDRFADAYVAVGEIHREYSERLQETEATEEAQSLQQEANETMVEAIRDTGLEVQEYSAVAAALERNPEMRERVVSMIEERR